MSKRLPRIFTIAPGNNFLDTLANAVLQRFPVHDTARDISSWTILLPTRRSARAFADLLIAKSDHGAAVLPRIRPIGDVDEIDLIPSPGLLQLPQPISSTAQLFQLARLVRQWAAGNPHIPLAQEIAQSPTQWLNLSKSLNELVVTLEVQEQNFNRLPEAYDAELSEHRTAVLSLFDLLRIELPKLREREGIVSATAYRSKLLRLEAERISSGVHRGPIIAAGSTGTIPATRTLLKAIALHEEGAVILPGLQSVDEGQLREEHSQFVMRQFLDEVSIEPSKVETLGNDQSARGSLVSEVMRSSDTADQWHSELPKLREALMVGADGVTELAAPDRHIEARAIALILRKILHDGEKSAALVTPDRDLARRVTVELQRWNIRIPDSAGSSLALSPDGSLLDLVLHASLQRLALSSRLAIVYHPISPFDRQTINRFEAAIRNLPMIAQESSFSTLLQHSKYFQGRNSHAHPLASRIDEAGWTTLAEFAGNADQIFNAYNQNGIDQFPRHLQRIRQTFQALAGDQPSATAEFLEKINEQSSFYPDCTLYDACLILQDLLRSAKHPGDHDAHPRIAIYGALEARLIPVDLLILGGLNEGHWPAQPDTGPWLNRTMRRALGLAMPEQEIGQAAHDFEQGFCYPEVVLTWSKRIETSPALPARWLLRLNAVLKAAGLEDRQAKGKEWIDLALALNDAAKPQSYAKPAFAPPVSARPKKFSVTDVEKLIRNPYAIYARKILQLEPLNDLQADSTAALRGSLFHAILARWNAEQAPGLERLQQLGADVFAEMAIDGQAYRFWWPQFLRAANWVADYEAALKQDAHQIHSEISGRLQFELDGEAYRLTARADRIDALRNGRARLIDYKTGAPPTAKQVETGLSPQLTLEAAIAMAGGFEKIVPASVAEALYIQLGSGRDGLNAQSAVSSKGSGIEALAAEHLTCFKSLMALYRDPLVAYLPRLRDFKDEQDADYDHLSRYLEWQLS